MADQLDIIQKLSVPRYAPRLEPLPIPEARWNDAPLLCLEVNDEWVSHILGVMTALDQSDTWLGTEDQVFDARQQVNEIMLAFMEVCMDCCGQVEIPLSRINEDGIFQQSTDGGITWVDAPQFDPRNNVPRISPFPSPDTDNAKCIYADSVVNHFKAGFIDVLEEGQTVGEVMATITAIVEWIFGPLTGPIGWIIPAIFAIATAVVIAGITLLKSEMTTTVWNGLRCLLVCHMQADGSFTAAQTSAIYAGIDDLTTDILPRTILKSWIAAIGATGLTNAAHLGMGTTGADCSACCPICGNDWEAGQWQDGVLVPYNLISSRGDGFIEMDGFLTGGTYVAIISSPSSDICCTVTVTTMSGLIGGVSVIPCGTDHNYTNFVPGSAGPCNENKNSIKCASSMPFSVRFDFVEECPP